MRKRWGNSRTDRLRRDRWRLKKLSQIKTWQLLVILLALLLVAGIFLRLNNLGMVERRQAVLNADKADDTNGLYKSAQELQNYVAHHMNTTTGRIALQYSYDRDVQAAVQAAKPAGVDAGKYQAATESCQSQVYVSGYRGYAQCVANAVGENAASVNAQADLPDADAYYLNFAAPHISLDPAGISVILAGLALLLIAARLIGALVLRIILRFKYKAV
ncbi:MAG: hypothetical protein LBM73_01890 [Candidatus Nomurabacteria bacterium]|jgi:hypothetical protein|nr:hypothetical protein [Candidatus Nomurabacteria bacterium]